MLQVDEVVSMLRQHEFGWGASGYRSNSAVHAIQFGDIYRRAAPRLAKSRFAVFDGLDGWLRGRFFRHDGDADVIRHLRYGGVTAVVLIDNAKEFVEHHDAVNREVRFNERLHAFV